MFTVRVGGVWLSAIAPWADLSFVHEWPHGSEQASWTMRAGTRHPALRGGALVEVFCGGLRIWRGHLVQPGVTGDFQALGSWYKARGILAVDGGGATRVPDTAVDEAISRGALDWTRPASLSATAWGEDTTTEPLNLDALLDGWAAGQSKRWYVDPNGAVRATTDPTTPRWHVPHAVAGRGLTLAEDDYYSHLTATYFTTGPAFATVTVGDDDAADRWGRREGRVDLTGMGLIDGTTATNELDGRFALVGARMGFADGLELGYGQIITPGGTAMDPSMVRAGHMVRLCGVTDQTRARVTASNTDIVIARSEYQTADGIVRLTPMGKATRNLAELLRGETAA